MHSLCQTAALHIKHFEAHVKVLGCTIQLLGKKQAQPLANNWQRLTQSNTRQAVHILHRCTPSLGTTPHKYKATRGHFRSRQVCQQAQHLLLCMIEEAWDGQDLWFVLWYSCYILTLIDTAVGKLRGENLRLWCGLSAQDTLRACRSGLESAACPCFSPLHSPRKLQNFSAQADDKASQRRQEHLRIDFSYKNVAEKW